MKTNKNFCASQKNKIWEKNFGNKTEATDLFGRKMTKNDFVCDHIYPKSLGGKTDIDNLQPLSFESNEEKGNLLSGTINKKMFRIEQKDNKELGIGKMIIVNN